MSKKVTLLLAASLAFGAAPVGLAGCAGTSQQSGTAEQTESKQGADAEKVESTEQANGTADKTTDTPVVADGEYSIEVETDSSMFRAESCTLTVKDGSYSAELVLPGEGFSRLYFGTAEDAAAADAADIYDYHLNDDGLYTFDIPVEKLDEELSVAAYGQRRDTWYDHTIIFHAPAA